MAKSKPSTATAMPLVASRVPVVGDTMLVHAADGGAEPIEMEVTSSRGKFVWLGIAQLRFHVADDLISTEGGDAWMLRSGAVVKFAG